MIIDVHTHNGLPKDNPIMIQTIEEVSELKAVPGVNASLGFLLENMQINGIDKSVVFCLANSPEATARLNERAAKISSDKIIGFGTIWPDMENWQHQIAELKTNKVKGIKFHSAIQKVYPDDERLFPIYEEIGEDLVILFHSGHLNARARDVVYGSPQRIRNVIDQFPKMKVIVAHFGGLLMLEEAQEFLCGQNVYFDTSWPPSLFILGERKMISELIRKHGVEKILFGTDMPMGDVKVEMEFISRLPFTAREKELILGENARELLQI